MKMILIQITWFKFAYVNYLTYLCIMKEKLISALKEERSRLTGTSSVFGDKFNSDDHDKAIGYLETGIKPVNVNDYDLLYAVINDFETVCSDFDITE